MGQASRIEITGPRIHSYSAEVNICFNRREANMTQPESRPMSPLSQQGRYRHSLPLLLDHLEEVPVVHDTLKNGSQRQAVVSAEGRGEAEDWYLMGQRRRSEGLVRIFDRFVEVC